MRLRTASVRRAVRRGARLRDVRRPGVAESSRARRRSDDDEHIQEPGWAGGRIAGDQRADLAERIDSIAYPGLTANFDAGKSASLAITLLDWLDGGHEYAIAMTETAVALAEALATAGMPVFSTEHGYTTSHQFAVDAVGWGGGHEAALTFARQTSWRARSAFPAATSGRVYGLVRRRSCDGA